MESMSESIGLVGGGQMAEALIRGILGAGLFEPSGILVIDPSSERLKYLQDSYKIGTTNNPKKIAQECGIIVLAVKPQMICDVAAEYCQLFEARNLLLSIMAGVTLQSLEHYFPKVQRCIRIMPNTPALILEGAAAISANTGATENDLSIAREIFSAVGLCVEVQENLMDAVTGLSGSGPAYVFTIIDALIDGGVMAGLPRPVAEKLTLQTLYGSVKLAMESGKNVAELKAQVTSPGGTTIHGLHAMEQHGVRAALMDAVLMATKRSEEL